MKRIVCFGDSNTWGRIPGEKSRYPKNMRWTGLLQNHQSNFEVIEEGLSGRTIKFKDPKYPIWTTADYCIEPVLFTNSPVDVLILSLGTNELWSNYQLSVEQIISNYKELLDQIKKFELVKIPKLMMVEPTEFNMDIFPNEEEKRLRLLPKLKKLAEAENIDVILSDEVEIGKDGVHLSESGHKEITNRITDKLNQ